MHIMFDWETMGQQPDSVVVSLGAVAFNREGILGRKYWVLDWENQPGRSVDAETKAWWDKQKPEARLVFDTPKEKRISLEAFIKDNDSWIEGLCFELNERKHQSGAWAELKPWGNGANFDIVILEDIYRKVHPKGKKGIPWAFWNVWCYRTFSAMTGCRDLLARNAAGATVVKHNALADAEWQAQTVLEFWKLQDAKKKKAGLK